VDDKKASKGARFSIEVGKESARRPNPYELYQKIEGLDIRFREHVDKEESFWEDMTEMKMQIGSMFLAARWIAKITRAIIVAAVTLTPVAIAAHTWINNH
jgi:hypothetical protein